ncbi:hypothetical protein MAR_000721 [Mya arenaria]|uniref:Secreted protein n=1 Tax=Mya arenaria TaxID=6604 RepID=A0ABY7F9M5_MYAAR|nr:hypothetical protein MAR_000721 [Mya arenaria]
MDFNVLTCSCILVTGTVSLVCILVGLLCPSWTLVVISSRFGCTEFESPVHPDTGPHGKRHGVRSGGPGSERSAFPAMSNPQV